MNMGDFLHQGLVNVHFHVLRFVHLTQQKKDTVISKQIPSGYLT